MNLFRGISIVLCVFVASMFFFPFEFRALPGVNTKMMLAAISLLLLLIKFVRDHELKADKSFLYISILASLVSFCGMFSVTYNSTEDYAYATYITSCWVWWGAAYTVCQAIRWIHGKVTGWHIMSYLTAVSVFQCIMALLIDRNPSVKHFVNAIVLQEDLLFPGHIRRLYGIGACLDVAGIRFSAVLIMILFFLINANVAKRWYTYFVCLVSFVFIAVVGNMIARTTLVGLLLAIGLLTISPWVRRGNESPNDNEGEHGRNYRVIWGWLGGFIVLAVPICIWYYQTNATFHDDLRFAFEGFFNLAERGDLSYSSNETLKNMYVFPDNLKTWIIGDGYFTNPRLIDPYFTGEIIGGYYMGTDVGYLRFIFYFGVIGLLMFSFYFIEVGRTCMRRFPELKMLFLLLLVLHFAVWFKVTTDIFLVLALFLCLPQEEEEEEEALLIED